MGLYVNCLPYFLKGKVGVNGGLDECRRPVASVSGGRTGGTGVCLLRRRHRPPALWSRDRVKPTSRRHTNHLSKGVDILLNREGVEKIFVIV